MMRIHRYPTEEEAGRELAARVAPRLARAVDKRRSASIAVAGGRTPLPFFRALRERELPWAQVAVTLTDERWLAEGHRDRNDRLLSEELLVGPAAAARLVPLAVPSMASPGDGAEQASLRLAPLSPFDVAVVGMGTDGHIASLFPRARGIERGLDLDTRSSCVAIDPATAPHLRLSLTVNALLSARHLCLHIAGAEKWATFERAREDGPVEDLPVRALVRWAAVLEVFWASGKGAPR